MYRIGLSVLFVATILRVASGNELSEAARQLERGSPADVGIDAGRLDRAVSIVRHAVEDDEIPGAVVLVARRGRVILLLNKGVYGGKRILSEASVREMTMPQSRHIKAAKAYGLGWMVAEPGGVFSHTGSDGTYVWVDPADEVIGMVLTQTNSTTRPRDAVRRLVRLACDNRPVEEDASDGAREKISRRALAPSS
jgi:CubicO group peptidase (beta-lactamase class C family)